MSRSRRIGDLGKATTESTSDSCRPAPSQHQCVEREDSAGAECMVSSWSVTNERM